MNTLEKITRNILVVDDDPIAIFLSQKLLQGRYRVTGVTNGHDALKALEEENFDLILMDINLGDERMDGLRTMRIIKQNDKYRHIKIIALTAHTNAKEFYIKQGFDELHLKPISEELVENISAVLLSAKGYLKRLSA